MAHPTVVKAPTPTMTQASRRVAWLVALLAVAVLVRAALALIYHPVDFPDTQGYTQMANVIRLGNWMDNLGARPPVYPAFLLIFGQERALVWLAQAVLGVIAAALFFLAGERLSGRPAVGFVAGLAASLLLPGLFLEAVVMSEALGAFLLTLTLAAAGLLWTGRRDRLATALLVGVLIGLATLTRPSFAYAGLLLPVFALLRRKPAQAAALLAPFLALVLAWCAFNLKTADVFNLTSLTGYNLINHTGAWIEYAPDDYAEIRDVYLRHRAERIAETSSQSMTIWRAYPELDPHGVGYTQVSKDLTALSLRLILRRPDLYAVSVFKAWVGFWKAPIYWQLENVSPPGLVPWLRTAWTAQRAALLAINFAFLVLCLGLAVRRVLRKAWLRYEPELAMLSAVIFGGSVFQALLDYGENPRYGVPFQALIVWCVLAGGWMLWNQRRAHRPTTAV